MRELPGSPIPARTACPYKAKLVAAACVSSNSEVHADLVHRVAIIDRHPNARPVENDPIGTGFDSIGLFENGAPAANPYHRVVKRVRHPHVAPIKGKLELFFGFIQLL